MHHAYNLRLKRTIQEIMENNIHNILKQTKIYIFPVRGQLMTSSYNRC